MKSPIRLTCALVGMWVWCSFVSGASALPAGRAYEMVSPIFKGGYAATERLAVGPEGESVAFFSAGVFNGNPAGLGRFNYLARRDNKAWLTEPLLAPSSLLAVTDEEDLSSSLGGIFVIGSPGASHELQRPDEADLILRSTNLPDLSTNWEALGVVEHAVRTHALMSPNYFAGSQNFCHVLLAEAGIALLPQALGASEPLYEFNRGCEGQQPSLQLINLNNSGSLISPGCHTALGASQYSEKNSKFNAMSTNGEAVFFTVCVSGEETGVESPHQLFARIGESKTLEISRPLGECGTSGEVPCGDAAGRASSDFAGASEDGSTVYFTTAASLVGTDKDAANDLYMSTIGCPEANPECGAAKREVRSLVQVSQNPNGGAAEVQGVVRVAPDGKRVYYVAKGDLLTSAQQAELESEGRPVPQVGADNLYVYDNTAPATTGFIADLCSEVDLSGSVEDIGCPSAESDSALWSSLAPEAQTAGVDAGFLVFATMAQLSTSDTNAVKDVYRYDAETGSLQRVSIGEDGYKANGNEDVEGQPGARIHGAHWGGRTYEQYEMDSRAISEDGSRIIFTSATPLSPDATNGLVNAYEWHESPTEPEGSVSLVSTGSDETAVNEALISPNGRSVFFLTTQGLVPQDTDGASDVYDARLEGGFPPTPAEPRPCQGDACQGPLTNPAPLLVPGSVLQEPGSNFAPPKRVVKPKKKSKVKKKAKKKVKHGKRQGKSSRRGATTKRGSGGKGL